MHGRGHARSKEGVVSRVFIEIHQEEDESSTFMMASFWCPP